MQVDEKALETSTIAKMRPLFNNYEMDTTTNEHVTPNERKEENDFLDAIMATNVMRQAMLFLQNKGKLLDCMGSRKQITFGCLFISQRRRFRERSLTCLRQTYY